MIIPYTPVRKGTLLIPTGPCYHLHIICNDPVFYPTITKECVLAVNISTIDPCIDYDKTCLLNVGDHPFIKHESYVYYRKADIFGASSIARSVADGTFSTHAPFDDPVFDRVLAGFTASNEVRLKIRRFYENYCI